MYYRFGCWLIQSVVFFYALKYIELLHQKFSSMVNQYIFKSFLKQARF